MNSFSTWHWLLIILIVAAILGAKNLRNLVGQVKDFMRGFMDEMKSEDEVARSRPRRPQDDVPNDNAKVTPDLNHWYSVLEINRTATPSAVRDAYRRKMQEYHPDKVVNLGKELRDLAEEKTKQINRAYQEIERANN